MGKYVLILNKSCSFFLLEQYYIDLSAETTEAILFVCFSQPN